MGCYVGLRPKQSESGERQPELRITKEGDVYLRKLLVQGAHCIMAKRAPDTDLKTVGHEAGGTRRKERKEKGDCGGSAETGDPAAPFMGEGEVYEPLRNSQALAKAA